ncbi:hypothetical protein KSP39_PZI012291 [Platanthera zijinensis]|uniref:Uncharacterized protein n=1 Tax=Platanthera zijinensis TaxID=2320716 RepID=A0AAP0BH27_9ASPA
MEFPPKMLNKKLPRREEDLTPPGKHKERAAASTRIRCRSTDCETLQSGRIWPDTHSSGD